MSGALALVAGFVGFACLIYAVKGNTGGSIDPGGALGQLLRGNYPYTGQTTGSTGGGLGGTLLHYLPDVVPVSNTNAPNTGQTV